MIGSVLISSVLGRQPTGDVSRKPSSRQPLFSFRLIVIDCVAGAKIHLVASVCVSVPPFVRVCACMCVRLSVGTLLFESFDL